jgi:hypothetical protein
MACKADWTRRDLLKLIGASSLVFPLACERQEPERAREKLLASGGAARRPRFVVRILCSGGIDPLYTTDPKSRGDVARSVEIPYKANDIVESGHGRLGPQFSALKPYLSSLAILNGVRLHTANHPYGWLAARLLKTRAAAGRPGVLDIIGAHRDHQALACMSLGPLNANDYNTFYFGSPDAQSFGVGPGGAVEPKQKGFFDMLDGLSPTELEATLAVLKNTRNDVGTSGGARAVNTREKIEQAERYVSALMKVEPFRLQEWSSEGEKQLIARNLQRILWAMENDLAATYFMRIGNQAEWDTHFNNLIRQKTWNEAFAPMFAQFLGELQKRKSSSGLLWDQVAVVVSSEIGRHPEINAANGKDHFPECPYLFAGPCFQLGKQFGVTGKKMEAHGISLATGAAQDSSAPPDLTDIGTTLLQIAGLDPSEYGYYGRSIEFLRAV